MMGEFVILVIGAIFLCLAVILLFIGMIFQEISSTLIFISIVFFAFGIYFLLRYIKSKKIDKEVDEKGEICYGFIKGIKNTGIYKNSAPELNAIVCVYVNSTKTVESSEDSIGFAPGLYPNYSYVKVKYYNGNINILEKVEFNNLPIEVQNIFTDVTKYMNIEELNAYNSKNYTMNEYIENNYKS